MKTNFRFYIFNDYNGIRLNITETKIISSSLNEIFINIKYIYENIWDDTEFIRIKIK